MTPNFASGCCQIEEAMSELPNKSVLESERVQKVKSIQNEDLEKRLAKQFSKIVAKKSAVISEQQKVALAVKAVPKLGQEKLLVSHFQLKCFNIPESFVCLS